MSNATEDTGLPGTRNKGQSLVAGFRAARLSQLPSLRNELRRNRDALRQERLTRLGRQEPPAPQAATQATPAEENHDADKPDRAPALATAPSVFASFIDSAAAPPPAPPPAPAPEVAAAPAPAAVAVEGISSEAAPGTLLPQQNATQASSIPLSAIGFGPGMMIRLSQLGIESAADLASADATSLRSALGDISRLINVDLWIASARDACAKAA